MLDSLTTEQNDLVEANRDAWLAKFFSYDVRTQCDPERITNAIKALYKMCDLAEPEVVIVDSPKAAQLECNRRAGTLNEPTTYGFSNYGNASDFGWIAFYDTFIKLGVKIEDDLMNKFNIMREVIESGCFMSIQLEGLCVVSKMPLKINRDSENRLHSTTEAAVEFMDGYKQHYVAGRFIEESTFIACDDLEKAGQIFNSEDNEDIKSIICFIVRDRLGDRGLLDMLKAELYAEETVNHTSEYTEILRLYRTREKFSFLMDSKEKPNQPYCWLEYTCPSTGTVYLIDTFADFKNPIEAAKFHRPAGVPHTVDYKWEYFAN
jgi:hypothetical protein